MPLPGDESVKLQTGNFNGVQIDELGVFGDGVSVSARADTEVIDAFLRDVYSFVENEFGTELIPPETRHYESSLVVELDERATGKFDFLEGLYNDLAGFRSEYGLGDLEYALGGFRVETDPTATSSNIVPRFTFERRIRIPFSAGQWFSSAPLRTKDHIAVLENLERQLLR